MSTLASFASAATAALLTPSGGDYGYYSCDDNVSWDNRYHASATTRFDPEFEKERLNELRFTWTPSPSQASQITAQWFRLAPGLESLPPPDKVDFGIKVPRKLQGGTILLIPPEGELVGLPARKPAVTYRKYDGTIQVEITDPAQRARLVERAGWRIAAIDSKGKVAAQGPLNLPDRAGMEIRYRPLAQSLRAKAAAYEKACTFEPQTETR